jgi:dipeptidyl aminopeptidase/acylaminoacyl peptidase
MQLRSSGFVLLVALALSAGCGPSAGAKITITGAPVAHAPTAPVPLAEYFKIARVSGFATFSHDESLVAYVTDAGGRMDVWVAPVGGGAPRQVTHVEGFVAGAAFSPTQDVLVYGADVGGNELPHLFLTNAAGSDPRDLDAGDPATSRADLVRWADDGKSFVYVSNRRDEKYLDLYEYVLATGNSELLWESSGVLAFALPSRDHTRYAILETLSDVNTNIYLARRGKKETVLLTSHEGDVMFTPTAFSADGSTLYYTSDEGREFTALYAMDLATKRSKLVLEDVWDVEYGAFSQQWKYFFTKTNEDGTPKIVVTDAATGQPVAMPSLGGEGALVPLEFSHTDRFMAATLVTDTAPVDLYVIDLETGKATRLTDVKPESLRGRTMVAGESTRIPSFDQRPVPAYVYRPSGSGPFPAVIDVHGGPTSQSTRRFDRMRQYLVSKGYVVLVPNVRGSTGYGKTYTKLDNLDLGGGPLQDVVACKRWMVENAGVSADRVIVLGGSYGGYMALAAAAFTPGEFAAQVDYFGVSDLKSLVESFPPYWAAFATYIYRKFGDPGNPEHAQYQHDRSPLNYVDRIVTPLLVVQGENDARVKQDQSDRVVAALRERKVPVHYLILPGEGHGFSKNENMLAAYELTDRFLDRYIWGDTAVELPK